MQQLQQSMQQSMQQLQQSMQLRDLVLLKLPGHFLSGCLGGVLNIARGVEPPQMDARKAAFATLRGRVLLAPRASVTI